MYALLFIGILECAVFAQGIETSESTASSQIIYISATNISTLHQYLDNSHHEPLCVLRQTGSQLEWKVRKLWMTKDEFYANHLTSWVLAMLQTTQIKRWPRYLLKESHSSQKSFLRCFLGPVLAHDFEASGSTPTTKNLQKWFHHLGLQYSQLVNSSVDTIEASVQGHRLTLVTFPTANQHEQLEQAVFQAVEALSRDIEINVIVIHSSSTNVKEIKEKYKVYNVPCVLVIEKEEGREREERQFSIHDVMRGQMEMELRALLVPAPQLTLLDFEKDVLKVNPGDHYSPYLVGFYAHWQKESPLFLSFLLHTVLEFQSLGADLRFGLVDSARYPEVVSLHMSPMCLQHLPFLAVFHAEEGQTRVTQTELLITRPSPYTVYAALKGAGLTVMDRQQQPISYQPYGQDTQVCLREEGPDGNVCPTNKTIWLSNGDSLPPIQDPGTEEKEAESTIPVATSVDWQIASHSPGGDDATMSVSITIFIFIRHPCKSCEQNQPHFLKVYQQLSTNESYTVHMVNCSQTPVVCEGHHVTGFPTLLAFRRHTSPVLCTGDGPACLHEEDACGAVQSVRLEYHGVLTEKAVMAWVNSVSRSPVKSLRFSQPVWAQDDSVQLVATVVPVHSPFLPLPPRKRRDYFYSAGCFGEVCERLFGQVACFAIYSADVPPSQYGGDDHHDHHLEFAVTQVKFRRRDGVEMTLMQLGASLSDLVEEETNHLHMFHSPHSYSLPRKQKCEEDHGSCTEFLEAFTRDHLRLPVTPLTSEVLHSHSQFLFGTKPVLLALMEKEDDVEFLKMLQAVAYAFYKEVIVATLDVNTYRAWASSFVPRGYSSQQAESSSWGRLSVHPRLCLFYWSDRTKAAFYPAVDSPMPSGDAGQQHSDNAARTSDLLTEDSVADFVRMFLQNPVAFLVETERF